jgi:hypothetical protein
MMPGRLSLPFGALNCASTVFGQRLHSGTERRGLFPGGAGLIVPGRDPAADIRNTKRIERVFLAGDPVPRQGTR